tara:strand:+ start:434 stop:901 length:468 start_codon:yes stop_codon:yes gene_type:complete
MINWFHENPGLTKFIRHSPRKKAKIIEEKQADVLAKRSEMMSRIRHCHTVGDLIETMRNNGVEGAELDRERDRMRQGIAAAYSIMNDYTRSMLWLEIHIAMAIEGFSLPEDLVELRKDLDYGLLNLRGLEGIEKILERETDSFDILEQELRDRYL